jgi:pimeloyl-ACP methyl ester carboxylesterase
MLTPQLKALPFILPLIPAILAGRPVRAPETTLRELAVHDLPQDEQRRLLPTLGAESGRAHRTMLFGLARLPGNRFTGPVLCVSGDADRVISQRTSKDIARHYGAQHVVFSGRGHWLIAASAEQEVAGTVLRWLEAALATTER